MTKVTPEKAILMIIPKITHIFIGIKIKKLLL